MRAPALLAMGGEATGDGTIINHSGGCSIMVYDDLIQPGQERSRLHGNFD